MHEIDVTMYDCINVVLDIFRVGSYDRTIVVVIRVCKFVSLKRNTRVKDMFYSLVDQPLYMSVSKLCRVTLGFAWNGFNAQLVYLSGGGSMAGHGERTSECAEEELLLGGEIPNL